MNHREHRELVEAQFGSRARAYVESAVHAQGPDLQALTERVRGKRDARVLDLGCGGGHVSFTVAPHVAEVVACDPSPEMLRAVERAAKDRELRNIVTECAEAERLPFGGGTFDFVVTRFSAHHWGDLAAGIAEARRVLKPSGEAVFIDVIAPSSAVFDTFLQSVEVLRDPSHVRDYSERDWTMTLHEAGFRVHAVAKHRLRMEFSSWTERMGTPAERSAAIRSLQRDVSREVARYFEFEPDGSFTFDVGTFVATARR